VKDKTVRTRSRYVKFLCIVTRMIAARRTATTRWSKRQTARCWGEARWGLEM